MNREEDFRKLEDALRAAAFQLCAPSLPVRKLMDLTPETPIDGTIAGSGFDLTADVSPQPTQWVLPPGATGTRAVANTDGNGFANFQWNYAAPGSSNVTITEVDPSTMVPGLVFDPNLTRCTYKTPANSVDTVLPTTPTTLGFQTVVPPKRSSPARSTT